MVPLNFYHIWNPIHENYNSLNINESRWQSSIKPNPFILARGTNEYIFRLWTLSRICEEHWTNSNAFQSKVHLPLGNKKSNTYNLEWKTDRKTLWKRHLPAYSGGKNQERRFCRAQFFLQKKPSFPSQIRRFLVEYSQLCDGLVVFFL